jgi:acetyl esterase/lipase
MNRIFAIVVLCALLAANAFAQTSAPTTKRAAYSRIEDVVYGRSYGTALTLDVIRPTGKQNGAGVIVVVSGGWFSAHESIGGPFITPYFDALTKRGYTVFAVCHGCQPRYQIPEILDMMNRSVRFIRLHANEYGIDPQRLGITGGSAGGHLSLMQGLAPKPPTADAPDKVDRMSSQVQAVACFFPPTDFLNYGQTGHNALDDVLKPFMGAFDFRELSKETAKLEPIRDRKHINQILSEVSPANYVSADDPPTLILHGDADKLVPIQQAQLVIGKLKAANVPCELVTKPGAGHGWPNIQADMEKIADWFDQYLKANR